jgi:hypothetical protein
MWRTPFLARTGTSNYRTRPRFARLLMATGERDEAPGGEGANRRASSGSRRGGRVAISVLLVVSLAWGALGLAAGAAGAAVRSPRPLGPVRPGCAEFRCSPAVLEACPSLSAGDVMKAERERGLASGCACGALEDDLEVAVAAESSAQQGSPRTLRGGSGDGVATSGHDEGGRIEMIVGPMFAGKSTELMRRIRRHKLAYRRCVVIKYAKDMRHGEPETELATHDNHRIKAVPCTKLYDVWNEARDSDVIGIDEAQFYPDLIKFCDEMADAGKIIIICALDGTGVLASCVFDVRERRPLASRPPEHVSCTHAQGTSDASRSEL